MPKSKHITHVSDTDETDEHEPSERQFVDETEAIEAESADGDAKEAKYKPADYERAAPLIDEMFEAEKEVMRQEAVLEEKRDALTQVVLALRDAMGGRSGPFTIDGERIQLRVRGKTGYFTVETATSHPTFTSSVKRAPRKTEDTAHTQQAAE